MDELALLFSTFKFWMPVVTSFTCTVISLFSYLDSRGSADRPVKSIAFFYFLSTSLSWITLSFYRQLPGIFVYLNSLCYLSFIVHAVLFYHLVFELTRLRKDESFSWLHYLLPFVISTVLLVWSLFIPYDVEVAIVRGEVPAGYESYAAFSTSKVIVRLLFSLVYLTLAVLRLRKYYKNRQVLKTDTERFRLQWLSTLIVLSVLLLLVPVIILFTSRSEFLDSIGAFISLFILIGFEVILTMNMIKKNYFLFVFNYVEKHSLLEKVSSPTDSTEIKPEVLFQNNQTKGMSRKEFENYFCIHKPYLNPELKLNELAQAVGMSRNELSAFINQTYGMNFNRYLNKWRMNELEKMQANPAMKKEGIMKLVLKAGFGTYRSYIRAREMQNGMNA